MNYHHIYKKLKASDKTQDVLALDVGQGVYLVLSKTGKLSTWRPKQGFTVVTEEEACRTASHYWHEESYHKMMRNFSAN